MFMPMVFFALTSILCFFIDDNYVTPDFDKSGNILVYGQTRILASKLLLSIGFLNFFMFNIELLSLYLNIIKRI